MNMEYGKHCLTVTLAKSYACINLYASKLHESAVAQTAPHDLPAQQK